MTEVLELFDGLWCLWCLMCLVCVWHVRAGTILVVDRACGCFPHGNYAN